MLAGSGWGSYSLFWSLCILIRIFSFLNFQWNSCIRHSWGHLCWLVSLDWSHDSNFNGIDCHNGLLLLLPYWSISSPFWRIRCFQVKIFYPKMFYSTYHNDKLKGSKKLFTFRRAREAKYAHGENSMDEIAMEHGNIG